MGTEVTANPVGIGDFVAGLRNLPESAFDRTDLVIDFLRSTPVLPETLAPYLTWDSDHYTRNLIDRTRLYELMAICWDIGQISAVHNHRDQNCWMAVPIGRLLVQNYRTISQDLTAGQCKLEVKDTVEMNAAHPCPVDPQEPVHRVLNPRKFNQKAVSLHIYSRPFDSCVIYSPEEGTCGEVKLRYTTEYGKPPNR